MADISLEVSYCRVPEVRALRDLQTRHPEERVRKVDPEREE